MKKPGAGAKRILVVEDEPAVSNVCRRVLDSEGFEVDIAANGKIAQDMLKAKKYDLCLFDIRTPTMNGKELYQWLKERHPQLASRVIFTTGDVVSGDTQGFLEQATWPLIVFTGVGIAFNPKKYNNSTIMIRATNYKVDISNAP